MALKTIKLGELIEISEEVNSDLKYSLDDVKGISINKMFIETKADMQGVSLKPYLLVKPDYFSYVPTTSRNGEKITLAHNNTSDTYIVSSSYIVFYNKRPDLLNSDYLFIYFNRPEFDRYSRFNSWGSARETFSWEEMRDIDFELPDLPIQKKYVDVYLSMVENQKAYEHGLDDLKLTCDAYIEDLRRKMPCEEIGKYIEPRREKNVDNEIKEVYGVSTRMQFIKASSSVNLDNLSNYKIVEKHDIAYVPTTHMKVYAIAISNKNNPFVVSPIYEVFRVKDRNKLNPEFLFLWLCRDETIRYSFYHSWGSARENFVFDDMCTVKMPIPDINIQNAIVNIYKNYIERKKINERLKKQIKDICPILIKGSINNGI